ncbi:TrmH family RNA methyltransferase [Porcipelethomonas sp.]|uniref:TrmH family RNA methyltransferase n=1 Tax=Porcipelethomonas sp. TaxID=2981675 RepID=UPI003EF6A5EB
MNLSCFDGKVITSKDNPSVKLFGKLMTSKKTRMQYRMFPLEGVRLVFDALKSNAPVRRIFITESALEKNREKLEEFDCSEIDFTCISDELGDRISGTDKTQGIFAQCSFTERSEELGNLKKHGRYAVLYQLQDPGNAGMIIRTADALGLDGVIFSESCDIYNPKVIRSTMGSIFRIPVFHDIPVDDIFLAMNNAEIDTYAAVVDSRAQDIKNTDFNNGGGIFIGNEGNGLPTEISEKCTYKITIKMSGNTDSLNAAMATGIMMWELMKFE